MRTPQATRSTRSSETDSQNRAEGIRRRRVTRSQERISTVSTRVSNPVTTRGGGFGTPIHRQAGTRPRRQFYVAMDSANSSELRLPAIPMINPGWRLISGIIFILAAIAVFSMFNSPFFKVVTVDVQGLQRLNGADLQAVLRLENLSIIEVQPDTIHEALAVSFPELADVQVSISLPNAVKVTARERQPIVAWQMEDTTRWIDAEGYVFPARGNLSAVNAASEAETAAEGDAETAGEGDAETAGEANAETGGEGAITASAPLVTITTNDEIPLAPLTEAEVAQLQKMMTDDTALLTSLMVARVNQAPAELDSIQITSSTINRKADLTLLKATLLLAQKLPESTPVVYDQINGLGWSDPQGCQVFIGTDLVNFEIKYALVQSISASLTDQGIQPSLINVEHINAPFYRLGSSSVEQ